MTRSRRFKRGAGNAGRFIMLSHWMMRTSAWKSLSANARAIYIEMAMRYMGSNNGQIPYAIRDAAKSLHIGNTTAANAIEMLQDRGFVVVMTKGAFSRKNRHATEWRLTEFGCDVTSALASKEFARWSAEIQNTVPVAGPTVPVAGLYGACSGTMALQEAA